MTLTDDQIARKKQLEDLFWLADAPLFIDERYVGRFFDAVVRPKYEHVSQTEERSDETEDKILGGLGLKGVAGLSLPEWLKPIKLQVEANASAKGEHKTGQQIGSRSEWKPIWTAERQLEELTRHYLAHHRERVIVGGRPLETGNWPQGQKWYRADPKYYVNTPRALAFLDFPPGTMLLPMAAEFVNGATALLYEGLVDRLTTENGGPARKYPDNPNLTSDQLRQERKAYWSSFQKFFNSRSAMIAIEEAATKNGRIQWIDFRVPVDNDGSTIHLHIVPAGTADAGTFAYNFVRRTFGHGVRIVGALKSEPDVNVMAIYEK